MSKDFLTAVKERRTFYGISKESPVSDERIQELVEHALKYTPSAFNSQGTRIVLLLHEKNDRHWNIVEEALRKIVPPENFAPTAAKIDSFRIGYGTVLFFEDNSVIEALQAKFPLYKDNFPVWAQQTNGMHQYVIWTSLQIEGLGVSLQHYNERIEGDVKKEWNIPEEWKLIAQMPFGKPTAEPGEKEIQSLEKRFIILK